MEKEIQGFIKSIMADGKSKCTVSAYQGDLQQFSKAMDGHDLECITYADLREWADGLAADGLSPATRARKISSVRAFFRYCYKLGRIDRDPASGLECPKQEKKQPVTISMSDASNVLTGLVEHNPGDVLWFRNYAIISTFLYTGVRREELANIRLADMDMEHGTILIHGKGAKERFVYINETLLAVLSEYVASHRGLIKTAEHSEYLFPSVQSEKMSLMTVNRVVNKAFENAGIKEPGVSAHILRKRFATSVFQQTGDIATTSELLGHSSPTVTMRYVVIGESKKRAAVQSVNY